jgi:gliding motility-associated-like protein
LVNFVNNSTNGLNYFWNFGDGNTSTVFAPAHTYTTAGIYTVQLISNNNATCNIYDTTYTSVVVVPPFSLSPIPPINMCFGDSVSLHLNAPAGYTYSWTPNTFLNNANLQQPNASPPNITLYKVAVEKSGCFSYDSVQIFVFKNNTKILLDPAHACIDDTVKLSANQACSSYQWSNGLNTQYINVFQPNWYYLSTIVNNCLAKDSIRIDSFAHVSINSYSLSLCLNEKKQLFAPLGGYIYTWQPNYKIDTTTIYNPIVSPNQNTTYTLSVFNGPCLSTGIYDIKVYGLPTLMVTPKTIEVFSGEIVQMSSVSDTISSWEPSYMLACNFCNNSAAIVPSNITYYATVTNKYGCIAKDSVVIKVIPTLYIPNSFSPNGDFLNDIFKPEYTGYVEVELLIFDRWGEQIFKTNDLNGGWNGKYKESNCEMGVYIYKLTAKDISSKTLDKVGHVTLIR